jgi:O-antigen/teichoic acid export membrane protein
VRRSRRGRRAGLPISALVTENADWHALFWTAAVLGAVVFVLVLLVVPVSVLRTAGRFDYAGALGLALGLLGILLAISRGDAWGWGSAATLGCGLGGLAVLLVWGWYELRIAEPLLDLRVAARRPVLLTNIVGRDGLLPSSRPTSPTRNCWSFRRRPGSGSRCWRRAW